MLITKHGTISAGGCQKLSVDEIFYIIDMFNPVTFTICLPKVRSV